LDKALAIDPESARLYNLRGYAYLQKEALKEAREDIERAISLQDLAVAHRNLVLCMFLEEKGGEALQYLIGRIKHNPSDVENWILMGDIMKKGGDHDKARTYYEQVLKMDPDNEYAQKQLEE
jgi:Flp pilus assembly protein TadD